MQRNRITQRYYVAVLHKVRPRPYPPYFKVRPFGEIEGGVRPWGGKALGGGKAFGAKPRGGG